MKQDQVILSMLVQDGEMDGISGSDNSLELEEKNSDHRKENNLEETPCEDSPKEVQLAIIDYTISEVNQPNI